MPPVVVVAELVVDDSEVLEDEGVNCRSSCAWWDEVHMKYDERGRLDGAEGAS